MNESFPHDPDSRYERSVWEETAGSDFAMDLNNYADNVNKMARTYGSSPVQNTIDSSGDGTNHELPAQRIPDSIAEARNALNKARDKYPDIEDPWPWEQYGD